MDLLITKNGDNINDYIITYDRSQSLCSGIGSLTLTLEGVTTLDLKAWDEIILYEDSNKIGTYYVNSIDHSLNNAIKTVSCQDASKKMTDTFISTSETIGNNNYAKYWMTFLLNASGVSYNFTDTGNGALLNPEGYIGLDSAYNLIIPLLQQSGWYLYFDEDGTAVIGKNFIDVESNDFNLGKNDILSVYISKDDKMLRNRAVVWGTQDSVTGLNVFADISTHTPWDYDDADSRAVVYANSAIPNTGVAYSIANQILNEFAKITYTHLVEMPGFFNIKVGNTVGIDFDLESFAGIVTTIRSTGSAEGFKTFITLDERCPRLINYVGNDNEYVYISTLGSGVKRKLLDGTTWIDYSAGLLDFNIIDLMIKRGIFACVSESGDGYIRTPVTSVWSKFFLPDITDLAGNNYTATQLKAVSCDINPINFNIVFGYRTLDPIEDGSYKSWLVEINNKKTFLGAYPLNLSNSETDLRIIDNEILGETKLAVAAGPLKYILDNNPDVFWGVRDIRQFRYADQNAYTYGPSPSENTYENGFDPTNYAAPGNTSSLQIIGQDLYSVGNYIGSNRKIFQNVCVNKDESIEKFSIEPADWPEPVNSTVHRLWIETTGSDDTSLKPYHILTEVRESGIVKLHHFVTSPLLSDKDEECANVLSPVRMATTENVTLSGYMTIDDITMNSQVRVLVKDQTDPAENGIYLSSTTNWTRLETHTLRKHSIVTVQYGTENTRRVYQLESDTPSYGSTDIIFTRVLEVLDTISSGITVFDLNTFTSVIGYSTECSYMTGVDGYLYWRVQGATPNPTAYDMNVWFVTYDIKAGSISQHFGYYEDATYYLSPKTIFVRAGRGMGMVEFYHGKLVNHAGSNKLYMSLLEGNSVSIKKDERDSRTNPNLVGYGKSEEPKLIAVGYYKSGDVIKTYIKYRYMYTETFIIPECQKICPAVPGFSQTTYLNWGGIELSSLSFYVEHSSTKGYNTQPNPCCTARDYFDDLDYDEYYFSYDYYTWFAPTFNIALTTSLGNPVFVHLGKDIYSALSFSKIGELQYPAGYGTSRQLILQMDDFDDSIYSLESSTRTFRKESKAGGVLAEVTCTDCYGFYNKKGIGGNFTNGYYVNSTFSDTVEGPSVENIDTVLKMKNSIIMSGVYLAYLLKYNTSGTYSIRDYDFREFKLEESYDFPLTSYTTISSVAYYTYSGTTYGISGGMHYRYYDLDFTKHQIDMAVNDVTITNLVGYSGADFGRYVISTPIETEYMEILNLTSLGDGLNEIPELSGYFGQVESTNYKDPNYIFVNTTSGGQQFYQRNTLSGEFYNMSINLPTDVITSIRADDIL